MKLIMTVFIGILCVQARGATLSCSVTTSWHHEANFKTIELKTQEWKPVQGAIGQSKAFLKFPMIASSMEIFASATIQGYQLSEISLNVLDRQTGVGQSSWADVAKINQSIRFPDRGNTNANQINQADIYCSVVQ